MASSMLTGDRKWGQTRKSGMTVLGKVPKPVNLPSQRLENHGLDPNVEIVPKGTLTWGSRSSAAASNAWGSSSLSPPNTDGSTGSPSYLSGSYTRPSTATSDKSHHAANIAWGPNSRPSSASGILPDQLPVVMTRPRSAETRHGGPHRSYFGESAQEGSAWGPSRIHEKLMGVSKPNSFNLSAGDFPTLSAEKTSKPSIVVHEADCSHVRPASASGRVNAEKETVDLPTAGNEILTEGNTKSWNNDSVPQNSESWRRDQPQIQPYPHQFDSWPGAHMVNTPDVMWFRGSPPGGMFRPGGPTGYPVDPYVFYPQIPARPSTSSHAIAYGPMNGPPYRIPPPVFDHNGPVLMAPPQSTVDSGNICAEPFSHGSLPLTGKEIDHDNTPKFRVLLKQHDRWKVNDPVEKKDQPLTSVLEPVLQKDECFGQTEDLNRSPPSSKRSSPLIEKIESLNNKARVKEDQKIEAPLVEATNEIPSREASLEVVESNASQSQGQRKSHGHSKSRFNVKKGEEWRNKAHASSSIVADMDNAENQDGSESTELSEGKAVEKPYVVLAADSDDVKAQHARMKEMARQRAKQLQREEEERTREQKARALAKLEELNRRSNQPSSQPSLPPQKVNDPTPEEPAILVQQKQGPKKQVRENHDIIPSPPKIHKVNDSTPEYTESRQKQGPQKNYDVSPSPPKTHKVNASTPEEPVSQQKQGCQKHMPEHHDTVPALTQTHKVNDCTPIDSESQPKQKFQRYMREKHDVISALPKTHKVNDITPQEPASSGQQKQKFQKHVREHPDVIPASQRTHKVNESMPEVQASLAQQKQSLQKHVRERYDVISPPPKTHKVNDITPEEPASSSQQKQKFQKHVRDHHDVIPAQVNTYKVNDSRKQNFQKHMQEQRDVISAPPNTREVDESTPEVPASSVQQKNHLHTHVRDHHDVIPGSVLVGSIVISSEHLMTTGSVSVDPPPMPEKKNKNGSRTTRNRSKTDESAQKEMDLNEEEFRPNKGPEEGPTKPVMQWKHQNQRKVMRNPPAVVVWAPVKSVVLSQLPPAKSAGNGDEVVEPTSSKSKRAEMERYVPKPIMAQESSQPMSSLKAANGSMDKSTDQSMGHSTVDLKAGEPSRHNKNGGKAQTSWRRRGPLESQVSSKNTAEEENSGVLAELAAPPGGGRRPPVRGHQAAAVEQRLTLVDSDGQPKSQWQLKSTQHNSSEQKTLSQVNGDETLDPRASKRQTDKREKRAGEDPPPPLPQQHRQHKGWATTRHEPYGSATAGPRHGRQVNVDQHDLDGGDDIKPSGKYRERAHHGHRQLPRHSQISASVDPQ